MKNKWPIFWCFVFIIGLLGWLGQLLHGDSDRVWRLFLVNFLYFSSFGAGLVAWVAITIASRGTWMKRLNAVAVGAVGCGPLMLISIFVLFSGTSHWAAWIGQSPETATWLNPSFMAIRQITALLIFWIAAFLFAVMLNRKSRIFSGWLIFLYAIVFSLVGFDLVMPLQRQWVSALFGGYFFISGLYIAISGWCFLSIVCGAIDDPRQIADLGKLMLTFCMLTTYLMFSQLIVIWYENIPTETSYLVLRMNVTQWPKISIVLSCMVYLGPILLLLWEDLKYNKIYMSFVSLVILTGMWIERWWLVMPSFNEKLKFGLAELTTLSLFTSAFALSYLAGLKFLAKRNQQRSALDRIQPKI